jgi:acetate kinase
VCRGAVEEIGGAPRFVVRDADDRELECQSWPERGSDFHFLARQVLDWVENYLGASTLAAVGHRIVHGGPAYERPIVVDQVAMAALADLVPLAPLHEPLNLDLIRAVATARPALPQVACFDTAFHRTMPTTARRLALPREFEADGVRRYGFHGLSYEYMAGRFAELAPGPADGRVIVAHLGNGASLCALREGRSVDTTMGFTPLDGLVMGTRCGDLDPGVVLYLQRRYELFVDQVEDLLYRRSGLLGVSGAIASDMRALLASTDPRAKEAIDLFVFRAVREIGALAGTLGGLDGLVFTAGIGEHAAEIRGMICGRLAWLGVVLDPEANARHAACIGAPASSVAVWVIPTDEELMVARHTLAAIGRLERAD